MELRDLESRLKVILPKGTKLARGHLAEIMRDDPALRLAYHLDLIDKAVANGLLEQKETDDGVFLSTVAPAEGRQG